MALVGNHHAQKRLKDIGIDGRIILKSNFRNDV